MNRIMMIIAALILVLPIALAAQGWNAPDNGFDDCKLTDEQREQIDDIHTNHQKQMIDLRARLDKLEIEQREALKDEDYSAARKTVDSIFDTHADMARLRIDMMEDISNILTDEQKANWRHRRLLQGPGHFGPDQRGRRPGMRNDHQGMYPRGERTRAHGDCTGDCDGDCDGPQQHFRRHKQVEADNE